jgi:hypoxanthine phosphoribosyltransferase
VVSEPRRDIVSWQDLDRLVAALADRLAGEPRPDVVLTISRGGLVPTGMLSYRMGWRDILVAGVAFYDEAGQMDELQFLQFPDETLLDGKRVLIVDEVWDSGTTIAAVAERVSEAGGRPVTAVLHYKPARSRVPLVPDHHVVETDAWVVYPFKAGR